MLSIIIFIFSPSFFPSHMVWKRNKVANIRMTQWLKRSKVMLQGEVSCDFVLGKIVFIPCEIFFQMDPKKTQKYISYSQLIKNDYKIRPYK